MASGYSNYLAGKIIDHLLRNVAFTPPSTIYLGLFTVQPANEAGAGTEVSGGSYARQALTLSAASSGTTSNSADVTFPTATADWGVVTSVGIFDAASAGNLLWSGALTTSQNIPSGVTYKIASPNLTLDGSVYA